MDVTRPLPTTIQLTVTRPEPLTGTAATGDGESVDFEGWMELIQAVATLLDSPDKEERS